MGSILAVAGSDGMLVKLLAMQCIVQYNFELTEHCSLPLLRQQHQALALLRHVSFPVQAQLSLSHHVSVHHIPAAQAMGSAVEAHAADPSTPALSKEPSAA